MTFWAQFWANFFGPILGPLFGSNFGPTFGAQKVSTKLGPILVKTVVFDASNNGSINVVVGHRIDGNDLFDGGPMPPGRFVLGIKRGGLGLRPLGRFVFKREIFTVQLGHFPSFQAFTQLPWPPSYP